MSSEASTPPSTPRAVARFLLATILGLLFGLCGYGLTRIPFQDAGMAGYLPAQALDVGLFVGVPLGVGFWIGYVEGHGRRKGLATALFAAALTLTLGLGILQAVEAEGGEGLVLVAPVLLALTGLGTLGGWLAGRLPKEA